MRNSVITLRLLVTVAWGFLTAPLPAAPQNPNIVLIFADDLGWKDVGYQGSDFYETPNIDRLAKDGMVFSTAYAAAGNCQPSRACLMSGQYTPRHHVFAVNSTDRGPKNLMRMIPIPNRQGLSAENLTLAEALKMAGYTTGIFGKWHLDGPDGASPQKQGFDVAFQSYAGWKDNQPEPSNPKGIYSLTRAASEFMELNRQRPFFVYLSHYAIHTALQARPETLARFKAKQLGAQHHNALYAACAYDLDDGIGLLLRKLADLNLEKNTLVVFTSDNGGTQQSSQEPLRGNKGCYYEGGIREPFIARWPGVIEAGKVCNLPVINVDLFPTFLEVAGVGIPKDKALDGESLLPLFKGAETLKRSYILWHFPGYLDTPVLRGRDPVFRTRPVSVIRKGDWKLHLYHEEWQLDGGRTSIETNNAVELYQMVLDPGEQNNLALVNCSKRDELLKDLLQWMDTIKAPLPFQKNPAYSPNMPMTSQKRAKKAKTNP